ncbi:major facilitator superfamily domain-containing protein 10 [Anabrus simplex]|uniref:major facilitator superfamily domain-containing protein 10 n=1 Tax=Anabrus simplex TaxID=316456 RepID=UPI0035A32D95
MIQSSKLQWRQPGAQPHVSQSAPNILGREHDENVEQSVHPENDERVHPENVEERVLPEPIVQGRKLTYIVIVSLVLDLLGFTMILPLFPSLLDFYRKNDSMNGLYTWCLNQIKWFQQVVGAPDESSSVLFGGVLGSMFSFLQFVASPIVGALSDVYGRKPMMLLCLVGIAFSYLLWGLSSTFFLFVVARFVGGISKGNVSLSLAIIADVLTPKERGSGMALVGIAFSIGFIIGPVIGAGFSSWSRNQIGDWYIYPAGFALTLGIINVLFVALMLPESLPREKRARSLVQRMNEAFVYINIRDLFRFRALADLPEEGMSELRRLGLVYFFYMFIYSGLEFTITFLTHQAFKYTSMQQGYMFFVVGIVMAAIQGGYVRKIPKENIPRTAVVGLGLIGPAYILVGISPYVPTLYAGLILYAVSTALVVPCMNTLVSEFGRHDQKGTVMGIFRALGALARAIGPVIFSIAFWSCGPTYTYLFGAVALFIPWIMLKHQYEVDHVHQQ